MEEWERERKRGGEREEKREIFKVVGREMREGVETREEGLKP